MSGELRAKKEDQSAHRPIYFFGKDLMEVKCFRGSFIFGICTGVVGGLATFLFTSKAMLSSHVAFASLWIAVFSYWIPCRYKYESQLLLVESFKEQQKASKKKSTDAS